MTDHPAWKQGNEEEGEEDEVDETQYKHQKDAVLFAIDVSASMLVAPPSTGAKKDDKDSPLSAALKCAFTLMQQRIISNPNDMIGILLYGTKETRTKEAGLDNYSNCYLLTDLCIPAAEDVKTLKSLIGNEEEFQKLMVPSGEKPLMSNVLFCANQLFATRAPNFASRRLFIVTDNDNPHENKDARQAATTRAKDLYDLGVMIELFPIAKPGEVFQKSKFYNDIVYDAQPSNPGAPAPLTAATKVSSAGDGITLLTSLLSSINAKAVPKRAQFSQMPLEIGPGFRISVKGYIIFKRQEIAKTCYVWLGGEKPQIAKGITNRVSDHEGAQIDKAQIHKAYKFGGTQITFTPEEISKLRKFGDPVIRIIGFKSVNADTLPIWANTNRSTFLYPSEDGYIGSTRVFSALHQKLLRDNKMAIAWHIARKNAAPVLCAVVSGAERIDKETDEQMLPPGLWLIPLPYADDIRDNPEMQHVPATEELIDKTRTIVRQLQLPKGIYDPRKYPNPQLQWHYRVLQALALDEDVPDTPEDKTVPKYKQIHKRTGEDVIDWREQLEKDHRVWQQEHSGNLALPKRPASGKGGDARSGTNKKIKLEEGASIMSDRDMREAWQKQALGKMTVSDLKAWMHTKVLETNGKKAELVERVESWFETQ